MGSEYAGKMLCAHSVLERACGSSIAGALGDLMAAVHYREGDFPPDARLDRQKLIPLLGPTAASVARYDGMLAAIPNPGVLLAPLSSQEAVLS